MQRRRWTMAGLGLLTIAAMAAFAACGGGGGNGTATPTARSGSTSAPATTPTMAMNTPMAMQSPMAMGSATAVGTPAAGGAAGTTVAVTEKDFAISADKESVPAGNVTFDVMNMGPSLHEFMVFRTDLAPDQLPVNPDVYAVDEKASGLTQTGDMIEIKVNESNSMTVDMAPGRYVLVCNLPLHYEQGMRLGFVVQ